MREPDAGVATSRSNPLPLYVATALEPDLPPFVWYKRFVLHGALEHGLPTEYVARIARWPARVDPDRARAEANLGILLDAQAGRA